MPVSRLCGSKAFIFSEELFCISINFRCPSTSRPFIDLTPVRVGEGQLFQGDGSLIDKGARLLLDVFSLDVGRSYFDPNNVDCLLGISHHLNNTVQCGVVLCDLYMQ